MNIIKKTSALVLAGLCLASCSLSASANESETSKKDSKDITSGDWTYVENTEDDNYYVKDLYKEGSIRLTSYKGKDKDVKIPEKLDGKEVTNLAEYLFVGNSDIEKVTLTDNISVIGESAFFDCKNLKSVDAPKNSKYFKTDDDILFSKDETVLYYYPQTKTDTTYVVPDSVTELWGSSFAYSPLEEITLPAGLTYIDSWAFSYNTKLTSIRIPAFTKKIGKFAFAYCSNLEDVIFAGSNLTLIDAAGFAKCSSLYSVDLPDSIETIGMAAFAGTGLKSIYIPSSVQSIGFYAFGYDYTEDGGYKAVHGFKIYGPEGGQGANYATMEDTENDYKNNFDYITDKMNQSSEKSANEKKANVKKIVFIVLICVAAAAACAVICMLIVTSQKKKHKSNKKSKKKSKK